MPEDRHFQSVCWLFQHHLPLVAKLAANVAGERAASGGIYLAAQTAPAKQMASTYCTRHGCVPRPGSYCGHREFR